YNNAWNFFIPEKNNFQTKPFKILTENVIAIETDANVVEVNTENQSVQLIKKKITAIPYYTWANRGKTQMQVWLPTKIKNIKVNYNPIAGDGGNNNP
ncbi:MAG TPA: hypothetical protein VFN30_00235, partial [Chitinophagaceae bacterium]|nr:hypothetical protein [Chitinophagaceae bacterium]